MSGTRGAVDELPFPVRLAVVGAVLFGCVGGVIGLVVGLRVYAPTAWAATAEVGLPAALLGAVLGLAVGVVVTRLRRGRARTDP